MAAVTTVDVVAHGFGFRIGDSVAVLDGEIGEATVGIQSVRSESACGTGMETVLAGAAMVGHGRVIGVESGGGDDFTKEKEAPSVGNDEIGVFAYPAQSCLISPITVEHGNGVATDFMLAFYQ